jgi:hypothetical protein
MSSPYIDFQIYYAPYLLAVFIGWRAGQIGYSRVLWALTSLLAGPASALCLLSSLPSRASERLRRQELLLIESQLRRTRILPTTAATKVAERTISDEKTQRG